MISARDFTDSAFSRNIGILTPSEQALIRQACVAVPGLGGVGGLHCTALARLGFGRFHIADHDTFELMNFNRQYGAVMRHLGSPKTSSIAEEIHQINPYAFVESYPDGLSRANLDAFLSGVDIVLDGLDFFAFSIRRMLFNRARELGIPVITAAPLGFTSSVLVFTPQSMSFDEYFDITDNLPEKECLLRFGVGLAPRGLHLRQMDASRINLTRGKGPSLGTACLLSATLAATEALRIVIRRPGLKATPWSYQVDPLGHRSTLGRIRRGNASPVQKAKIWFVRKFILGDGKWFERVTPPMPPASTASGAPSPGQLHWLLQAGMQAPSGDNCQPWRFSVAQGNIGIHLQPDVDTSFFNFRQLASVIACGAAAQNIVSVAPALGLEARTEVCPSARSPDLLCELRFSKGGGSPSPRGDAVWTRCTNRRPYAARKVDDFCREEIVNAARPAKLFLLDAEPLGRLAKLLYQADRIRVEHQGLHEHFMSMTRFSPPDGTGFDDGLPLKNLYAGAAGEAFLRLTRSWKAMRATNLLGLGRLVALHSRLLMQASPLAGLLCVESASREDFVRGGMALENMWLAATSLGLAVQPMTAITLFWLRWRLEGPGAFSPAHQRLLERLWPGMLELFPEVGDSCWPVMLFRAGYAKPIRYGTPRKRVEDAMLSK